MDTMHTSNVEAVIATTTTTNPAGDDDRFTSELRIFGEKVCEATGPNAGSAATNVKAKFAAALREVCS